MCIIEVLIKIGLHKMDQIWPNIDFQPKIWGSNIDWIHLKIIFYYNIVLVEHFLLMPWFHSSTFEKLYFLKMGPIFAGSYATQNMPIKKTICWYQLFWQKWAFSRLSTSVLHKCSHTIRELWWLVYLTKKKLFTVRYLLHNSDQKSNR